MQTVRRAIEADIREVLTFSRAVAVTGPRQAGKSTLARQLQASGQVPYYYTLDDAQTLRAALDDPDGFLADRRRPATIDEVQRAPDLMLAIKKVLDEDQTPGQYLLTGSADLVRSRRIADPLPGRVVYVDLWTLSQRELAGHEGSIIDRLLNADVPQIASAQPGRGGTAGAVLAGGYPDALARSPRQRVRLLESYAQSVLSRDLPELHAIRTNPETLERLLRLLAARTGALTNSSALAQELGLDTKTAQAHTELLVQLFLVLRLQPWFSNLGARLIKSPKLYLTDSGLAAALTGTGADAYLRPIPASIAGALYETFVVMEFVKQATWSEASVRLYFYRDAQQREVDLVIESASGDIAAVEIKSASNVHDRDLRGLRFLRDKLGPRFKCGIAVYSGEHTLPLGDRIWVMPTSGLWADAPR